MKYYLIPFALLCTTLSHGQHERQMTQSEIDTYVKNEREKAISEALSILTSPHFHYSFTEDCFLSKDTPMGRSAIITLIQLSDLYTIYSVLDGDNNTGKAYAIEALLTHDGLKGQRLDQDQIKRLEDVIKSDFEFIQCNGCLVDRQTSLLFDQNNYYHFLFDQIKGIDPLSS